jgi:hypothetical protein
MSAEVAALGLSTDEAGKRLTQYSPNAVEDIADRPLRRLLGKFSAPVPWLLEATVLLELLLGKYIEATVIFALLVFNAAIGFFQESRAQATLTALKSRLAMTASVLRDRAWIVRTPRSFNSRIRAAASVRGGSLKAIKPASRQFVGMPAATANTRKPFVSRA